MTRAFSRQPLEGLSPTEAAAHWRVRHDAGMDVEEVQHFDAWLAESPANAAAWARAEMAWALFEVVPPDAHLNAMRTAALASRPAWPPYRAAIAAGLALVALVAAALLVGRAGTPVQDVGRVEIAAREAPPIPARAASRPRILAFETSVGQRMTRRLADGTIVTLNTNSALEVAYAPQRRTVRLLRGQALFEVAKNRHRPFVVEAAGREITALGTVFEVRLDPGGMHVLLAEGRVSIVRARLPGLPAGPDRGKGVILAPGQSFFAKLGELDRVAPVNVESALLWRNGLLDFDDVTIAEAIAELNRYSNRRLVVRDPAIASLRVSGVFRSAAPDRFADAVKEVLPVAIRSEGDDIEIVAAEQSDAHGR